MFVSKWLSVFLLCFFVLAACSNTQTESVVEDSYEEEDEDLFLEETDEEFVEEEPVEELVEPSGIMEEWVSYTPEEKLAKIKECLEYESKLKEQKQSPIEILGTPEEFVEVIDARYEEIQGLTGEGGYEKYRMNQSSISAQIGIMGYQENLIEFVYNLN